MRTVLLIAALLFPVAALAQEESRVDEVTETSDGYKCRSHEMPELILYHDWRGTDRSATWEGKAREAGSGDLRIRVSFRPQVDNPSVALPSLTGIQFDMPRAPLRARPKSAHLRLDGISDPIVLVLEGNETWISLTVAERQREELAQRLMGVSIVDIDLVDALGTPLGRFSWDVRRLRRVNDTLQLLNWSCK